MFRIIIYVMRLVATFSSRVICPKIGSREEKRLLDLRRDCRGGGGIPGIDDNDSLLKDNGVWSLLIDSQVTHFP